MELEALFDQEGMPTFWFTLSAADNHWLDLHKIMDPSIETRVFLNEKDKLKWKRKLVRNNPHIVDAFFQMRVKLMLQTYFGKQGLKTHWTCFRIEYQKRGTTHTHGCFKLDCDPGIAKLALTVLKGHYAKEKIKKHEDINTNFYLNENDMIKEINTVNEASAAEKTITLFHDYFLSTIYPSPPEDANLSKRLESTKLIQSRTPDLAHPSSVNITTLLEWESQEIQLHYILLIDAVERHDHAANCDRNWTKRKIQEIEKKNMSLYDLFTLNEIKPDCRYGFPFTIPANGAIIPMHLKIIE